MEDWKNDTCVGKYLKSIYENRIDKNTKVTNRYNSIFSATKKYGGQFHFDVVGLEKKKIIGLDGLGGQQIIIDIDKYFYYIAPFYFSPLFYSMTTACCSCIRFLIQGQFFLVHQIHYYCNICNQIQKNRL